MGLKEEFLKKLKEKYGFEKISLDGNDLVINKNPKALNDIKIWVDLDFAKYMMELTGSSMEMEIKCQMIHVDWELKRMDYFSENPKSWWVDKKDIYEDENIEWV
jgi:hypothetical protein